METINALRVELAESLEELPAALHSSFPDLGVDFLHHVFSDVLYKEDDPGFGRVRRARNQRNPRTHADRTRQATNAEGTCSPSILSNQAPRVTRSSKRLRSLSNTTVGENSDDLDDSEDDATTSMEPDKDSEELKEVFERALEHIDRIKMESARLEEAALSIGARNLVNAGPVHLVRCVTCGKTVGSHAMLAHNAHCRALSREADAQTTVSGGAYTNDTASEMNGQARSTLLAIKSNIAPIKTRGSGGGGTTDPVGGSGGSAGSGGMPLSPVAISLAAQGARQMRSFQGVPNLKLELPAMSSPLVPPMSPRSQYLPR